MTTQLGSDAVRDLLATDSLARQLAETFEAHLDGPRAAMYLRVVPSATWDARLGDDSGKQTPRQKRAHRVLRDLLDGEVWSRELLAKQCDIPDRELRRTIRDLRECGWPVCTESKEPGGYWLSDDPDEIEQLIQHIFQPHADRAHETVASMRRAQQRCRAARDEGALQPAQGRLLFEEVA